MKLLISKINTSGAYVSYNNNAATASLMAAQAVWINIGASNFTINSNTTALTASTAYKWNYIVIQ